MTYPNADNLYYRPRADINVREVVQGTAVNFGPLANIVNAVGQFQYADTICYPRLPRPNVTEPHLHLVTYRLKIYNKPGKKLFFAALSRASLMSLGSSRQQHLKLHKNCWTDVIAFAFWEQYRLKCSFMFKKSVVSMNRDN